ncbi:hypothetical protein [Galactobacillus timonensis]|nr:hypothetical protein [Galactobacillus timonensis]
MDNEGQFHPPVKARTDMEMKYNNFCRENRKTAISYRRDEMTVDD